MATSEGPVHNSSDLVKDFCCEPCEEHGIEESAMFYCKICKKLFCGQCVNLHSKLYAKHTAFGRGDMSKWPLTKKTLDLLQKCGVHKDKTIEMFCQDHSHLCCTNCVLIYHRQCNNVALISESMQTLSSNPKQMSDEIQAVLEELKKLQDTREADTEYVEVSYQERLKEVRDMRQKINATLDKLENITLKELDDMRTILQVQPKNDIDHCIKLQDKLQQLNEAVHELYDRSTDELVFLANRKCMKSIQQADIFLKENAVKEKAGIRFQANADIGHYLSQQSGLGSILQTIQSITMKSNPDQVIAVKVKSEHNVKFSNDSSMSFRIIALNCLPTGEILIADADNRKVMLLDKSYRMVSHIDMSGSLWDMCQLTSSEVAVTVNEGSIHGVQFISLKNGQLEMRRKLQFQHRCAGIAHHQGNLYITSGIALYQYDLNGTLVKKLYEDSSGTNETVWKCAVSPTGDRLYITNFTSSNLVTLCKDGTLLATFIDPELRSPEGIHVTPTGQVLVCARSSHTIIQVDREGGKKLATLATNLNGVNSPLSVCYNRQSADIIVGQCFSTGILCLKVLLVPMALFRTVSTIGQLK